MALSTSPGHSFAPFFCQASKFPCRHKPNKTNHDHRKEVGPTLPGIIPEKRTIK
jgi:hypothetical protein